MKTESLELSDAIKHLLDECRMVLPGIQAVFGFQMVAVFNSEFKKLSRGVQQLHLAAIVLVVVAIVLLMTPASLHRQAEPRSASERFIDTASRLLLAAMIPLALGICIDVYVVAHIVDQPGATAVGAISFGLFVLFWLVFPRLYRRGVDRM